MNWLDILLVLIIGYSFIAGLVKGFTKIGIGFVAVIAGLILGLWFYGMAGAPLEPYIHSREARNLAGFFLIFLGTIALGALLGWALGKLFKWVHLSWLDRLLGGAFGLVRGVLVSAIIVLTIMSFTRTPPPDSVVRSSVAPYVVDAARLMAAAAPYEVKKTFQSSYGRIKQIWSEALRKGLRNPPAQQF